MRDTADLVYTARSDSPPEFVISVGGSAFFEVAVDVFDVEWRRQRPIRVVLRSGCYATHDSGAYAHYRELMAQEIHPLVFTPALELWTTIISRPEPGLAILDFGKRDIGGRG